jgi:hypothetical protein
MKLNLTMADMPAREGVGAFGLLITGLPNGIREEEGDAMQPEAAIGVCC